jgi:hypothetical protein
MTKSSSPKSDITSQGFFSTTSFSTLAGSTVGVMIITDTVQAVIDTPPDWLTQWLPLVIAMVLSVSAYAYTVSKLRADLRRTSWTRRLPIVLLNGCLIYTTAFGLQGVAQSDTVEIVETSSEDSEESAGVEPAIVSRPGRTSRPTVTSTRSLSSWVSIFSAGPSKEFHSKELLSDVSPVVPHGSDAARTR